MHTVPAESDAHAPGQRLRLGTAVAPCISLALESKLDDEAVGVWLQRSYPAVRIVPGVRADASHDAPRPPEADLAIHDAVGIAIGATRASLWRRAQVGTRLLILDRLPREAIMLAVLPHAGVSYLSRQAGPEALASAVATIFNLDQRVFDPEFAFRVLRTTRGYRLQPLDEGSIAGLTPREIDVWRELALGLSVAECAEKLQLSSSTIDNHRSRLMKKLGLHKASLLTRRAIRDGLIEL